MDLETFVDFQEAVCLRRRVRSSRRGFHQRAQLRAQRRIDTQPKTEFVHHHLGERTAANNLLGDRDRGGIVLPTEKRDGVF